MEQRLRLWLSLTMVVASLAGGGSAAVSASSPMVAAASGPIALATTLPPTLPSATAPTATGGSPALGGGTVSPTPPPLATIVRATSSAGTSTPTPPPSRTPTTGGRPRQNAAPDNDRFADAQTLALPSTVSGTTDGASLESGEPQPSCRAITESVWFQLTPSAMGTFTAHVTSAMYPAPAPTLALYSGSSLGALTGLGCDVGSLNAVVTSGSRYLLQLGTSGASTGGFTLATSVVPVPANDLFANAQDVGFSGAIAGTTVGALLEAGEPNVCSGIRNTVWYRFTMSSTGEVKATATATDPTSPVSPILGVYQGTQVNNLISSGCSYAGSVTADLRAGTYYLQVGSWYGVAGGFSLTLAFVAGPANDDFAAAQPLPLPANVSGSTRGATLEPNELPVCEWGTTRTVWYTIAPTGSGGLRATATGSGYTATMALYQGGSLAALTHLACSSSRPDRAILAPVVAGATYFLQVSGFSLGTSGAFTLEVQVLPVPDNDTFAGAELLTLPSMVSRSNLGATVEPNEPRSCFAQVDHTVWFRVSPSTAGTFEAAASSNDYFTPQLALYQGTSISGLTMVDCNLGSLEVYIHAGSVYYLQLGSSVDSYYGYSSAGSYSLSVAVTPSPANDLFANAQALALPATFSGSTIGASTEGGEPQLCYLGISPTVWYKFTPAAWGVLQVAANSGAFTPLLALYQGTALSSLTSIACGEASLTANVRGGAVYYLQLGGAKGSYNLTVSLTPMSSPTPTPTVAPIDPGPTGIGLLRVYSDPAVETTIQVNGIPHNDWGLDWLQLPSGYYTLGFGTVVGFALPTTLSVRRCNPDCGGSSDQPADASVVVRAGETTEVRAPFGALGFLRATTEAFGVAAPTIFLDGRPANEWGLWLALSPGTHTVSFGELAGRSRPCPQTVTVTAGETSHVSGNYATGACTATVNGVEIAKSRAEPSAATSGGRVSANSVSWGLLRVYSDPAVASTFEVEGFPRNDWGLDWLPLPAGNYRLTARSMNGFSSPTTLSVKRCNPNCSAATDQSIGTPVTVGPFETTEVRVAFTPSAFLRVTTEGYGTGIPTISVNGNPANEWGLWVGLVPGTYTVSFEDLPGLSRPCTASVTVTAGATTHIHGNYTTGSCTISSSALGSALGSTATLGPTVPAPTTRVATITPTTAPPQLRRGPTSGATTPIPSNSATGTCNLV